MAKCSNKSSKSTKKAAPAPKKSSSNSYKCGGKLKK